jgi:hypothetical protein
MPSLVAPALVPGHSYEVPIIVQVVIGLHSPPWWTVLPRATFAVPEITFAGGTFSAVK